MKTSINSAFGAVLHAPYCMSLVAKLVSCGLLFQIQQEEL